MVVHYHRDDIGRRSTVFQACFVHGAVSSSAKLGVNEELAAIVRLELRTSRRLNHGPTRGKHTTSEPNGTYPMLSSNLNCKNLYCCTW